jgi:organic radical activating enzyme
MEKVKFKDPFLTAKGEERAYVDLKKLNTLWFNTGTLCNLSCKNCYIESTPTNDRLSYLTVSDIEPYLKEVKEQKLPTSLIGLTGGEPFLNPHIIPILEHILSKGFDLLVLTNANRVIIKHQSSLINLKNQYGDKLKLRVSLDHHTQKVHEEERGLGTFSKTMEQLKWLYDQGFDLSIASRSLAAESKVDALQGHAELLRSYEITIDLKTRLVIFPEMNSKRSLPEITTQCWSILKKSPEDQMCATERMVVKRKGEDQAVVMPCTLLAYDNQFVLGKELKSASKRVQLNHPFCAEFCVLGGASCSSTANS